MKNTFACSMLFVVLVLVSGCSALSGPAQPTATPRPAATVTQPPAPTVAPQVPSQPPAPTVAAQPPAQPSPPAASSQPTADAALYDNFDGNALNLALWLQPAEPAPTCPGSGAVRVVPTPQLTSQLKDGAFVLTANCPGVPQIFEVKNGKRKRESIQLYELRIKVAGDQTAAVGQFWMQINESGNENWKTQCLVYITAGKNPTLRCIEQGGEYATNPVDLKYNDWFNVRISLNPSTMNFSYSVNGQDLGSHFPSRANVLLTFTPAFGIMNQGDGPLNTVYVDSVRLSP